MRLRCTMPSDAAWRNDATKSRSPLTSMLLRAMRAKPSAAASAVHVDRRSWCRRSRRSRAAARRPRRGRRPAGRRRGAARRSATAGSARRAPAARGAGGCRTASARRRARSARSTSACDGAGDRPLDRGNPPLQIQPQIDRDLLVARAARCAAGGRHRRRARRARARRTRARLRRRAPRLTNAGSADARSRIVREPAVDRRRVGGRQHAGARQRLPPTRRLPRTSSSNSRRSKRNDEPNANSSASGSPANRPDQRCAISDHRSLRSSAGRSAAEIVSRRRAIHAPCRRSAIGERRPTTRQSPLNSFSRTAPVTRGWIVRTKASIASRVGENQRPL